MSEYTDSENENEIEVDEDGYEIPPHPLVAQPVVQAQPVNQVNQVNQVEQETSSSEESKHVAIYSNDNDEVYCDYEVSDILKIATLTTDVNFNYQENESLSAQIEKQVLGSDFNVTPSENNSEIKIEEKKINLENIPTDLSKAVQNILYGKPEEKNLEKIPDYSLMKLPELKQLVLNKGLSLTKKINGQHKLKNKQDLINDLL